MGKINLIEHIYRKLDKKNIKNIQIKSIKEIEKVLEGKEYKILKIDINEGLGVRGYFEGKVMYDIQFDVSYSSYTIEFYLSYDQLEYYIKNEKNKIISSCLLEDFWEEEEHIERFIDYLTNDINKLYSVPYKKSNWFFRLFNKES